MAASQSINVNLNIQANTNAAKQSLADLSAQLTKLSQGSVIDLNAGKMTAELQQASKAAMELQTHLQNATNTMTGKLDFGKLTSSLNQSGKTLQDYSSQLLKLGPQGTKAFASLATQISQAEVPLKRTSKVWADFKTSLSNTVKWQLSSSIIHGMMGSVQKAFGYAKDLDKQLNNIRIVTGQSSDQMAQFALQANKAAKSLNTTTTEYAKASLIYYQQGLSAKEVQERADITIKMANVSGQSAQKVSDQMTAVWNNYDNGTKSLSHYADVMTALGAATASSSDEIAQGLQKFASISETVGLSYEYAASALATVTATTRESADVVGNSFKTLFSRIQGLQLGETLDDGTTFNKYSQGLAKVGIQIKDSAGDLKSMDVILDEMGSKWEGLAQDEKMALAQTVAGVRQYTQLMALMENYDYFKENLNIANTSSGTLQKQQDIYAESWEAANAKLRASFEGLWDSLINSESFINLTNGLSSVVDMFTSLTKAVGGGGGALSLLGAGLTKIYSKELVRGIQDVTYGVKNIAGLFGKNKNANDNPLTAGLNNYVQWAQGQLTVIDDIDNANSPFQGMPHMASALQHQMGNAAYMSSGLAYYAPKLSAEQQAMFQQEIGFITALDQRATTLGEQYDASVLSLGDKAAIVREGLFDANKDSAFVDAYIHGNKALGAANALFGAGANASTFDLGGKASLQQLQEGIKTFQTKYGTVLDTHFKGTNKLLDDAVTAAKSGQGDVAAELIRKFSTNLTNSVNGLVDNKLKSSLKGSIKELSAQAKTVGENDATYNAAKNASEGQSEKLVQRMKEMSEQKSAAQIMVSTAQALMTAYSASQSLASVIDQLRSTDETTKADKINNVIGNLVSTITTAAITWVTFSKVMGPKAALIATAGSVVLTGLGSWLGLWDDLNVNDLEKAAQTSDITKQLYDASKTNNEALKTNIENYETLTKNLEKVNKSSTKWAESLYEANQTAMKIIQDNNLQHGTDYYRDSNGLIQFNGDILDNIVEESDKNVSANKLSYDLAQVKLDELSDKENLNEQVESLSEQVIADVFDNVSQVQQNYQDNLDANTKLWNEAQEKYLKAEENYRDTLKKETDKDYLEEQKNADLAKYETEMSNAQADLSKYGGMIGLGEPLNLQTTEQVSEVVNLLSSAILANGKFQTLEDIQNYVKTATDDYTQINRATAEALFNMQDSLIDYGKLKSDYEDYSKLLDDERYENLARQALANETFKNQEQVLKGSGELLQALTEDAKTLATEQVEQDAKTIAKKYAAQLGYDQYKQFDVGNADAFGNVSYTYMAKNSETGEYETMTGKFTKDALISYQQGQIALDGLTEAAKNLDNDLSTLDNSTVNLNNAFQNTGLNIVQGEAENQFTSAERTYATNMLNTAKDAVASYLSQGDFGAATYNELSSLVSAGNRFVREGSGLQWQTAQSILQSYGFNQNDIDRMAQDRGLTTQEFLEDFRQSAVDAYNTYQDQIKLISTQLTNESGINQLAFGNMGLGKMSIDDLTNLGAILNNLNKTGIGDSNGIAYMEALSNLLNNVQGVEDKEALLSELLKIDPTGADAIYAIMAAVDAAGGSFLEGAAGAREFAAAIASINAPNLDNLVNQLNNIKKLLNDVYSLNGDSNVDDTMYEALISQFPELEPFFSKNAFGGWDFGGDGKKAREIARNAFLSKESILQDQVAWANDFDGKTFTSSFNNTFNTPEDMSNAIQNSINNTLDWSAGYFATELTKGQLFGAGKNEGFQILNELTQANGGQLGWGAQQAVLSGMGLESVDDLNTIFQDYTDAFNKVATEVTNPIQDTNNDGKIDEGDEGYENLSDSDKAAYAELNSASNKLGQIAAILSGLPGAENALSDFNEEKGSLATGVDDLASMYNIHKGYDQQGNLQSVAGFNQDGQLTSNIFQSEDLMNYAQKLINMGEAYDYSRAAAQDLQDAIADGNGQLAESLLIETEMATAIAQTAAERNLDAEAVAYHMEQVKASLDEGDLENISTENLANMAADLAQQEQALTNLNKEWKSLKSTIEDTSITGSDKYKALKKLGSYLDDLTNSTTTAKKSFAELSAGYEKFIDEGGNMQKVLNGDRKEITKLTRAMGNMEKQQLKSNKTMTKGADTFGDLYEAFDEGMKDFKSGDYDGGFLKPDDFVSPETLSNLKQIAADLINNYMAEGLSKTDAIDQASADLGYGITENVQAGLEEGAGDGQIGMDGATIETDASNAQGKVGPDGSATELHWKCVAQGCDMDHYDHELTTTQEPIPGNVSAPVQADGLELFPLGGAPKNKPAGGGGGGGGKAKEPKKVATKRKSQTVKRYKQNDHRREHAAKAKKSEENKKDYLYGEQKIAQLEKINKLAEKEAHITADRIKESREYLVEDRQNLIKMLSKYGFEAEFDTDGFLANYEQVWNELYKEIAALYEDNLLTEEEEKIEEELNIKLEEMEGALEDYENSLKELADDIEKYEESLFEIYDNKIEALKHKVEFKIELEEDDLEYLDFWIDSLGDSVYNAIESIEALGAKANMLFKGLEVYKQGVEDIYTLSDDPFQVWATGGLEDVLTQDQVDLLRDNRDGLADYMQQLIDLREEIKDKVIDTFDLWTERIDANIASIEHYSSIIEYFKNIVDTIGKDPFGLSDRFVNQLEQSAINQSMDYIESQKAYYESLIEQQAKAQEELNAARARGDESSAEHWEEVVRTTTETMEEAQDSLLSGLDNTLTLIAEQFESAMQRAVDAFNDAIYAHSGLEGLSADYDLIRENADLMAADYEKIYELSKLTRDINKVLDDTNIVAGKKKMNGLLKEINELQADGVELSKYDLEYLRAKYELRLAEIELENAQNSKDTVRLSKDSEGNWSYVYTQNADAVEEAEQKYEDALYEMQNLSQEYLEEMSGMMIETSQAMMEEISALRIQDFTSYEAYQTEIKRIQDKYAQSLKLQEDELNKSIQNSSDLYEQDWQAYNQTTGYKISLAENWVDSFREATLGDIMDIDTFMSGFSDTFLSLTDEMSAQLADAAIQYFGNVDTAMKTYGTSIEGFGRTTTTIIDDISQKSKTAKDDLKTMASEMSDAFKEIADYVSGWQEEFSGQIDTMLEEIKTLIQSINEAIRKSAELAGEKDGAGELIGSAEAIELLNATGLFGSWSKNGSVGIKVDGKDTNFLDYNAALIEEIDNAVARYANAKTGTDERERLGEELKELFKRYWQFRDIVNRVYDPVNLTTNMDAPTFTSFGTGGYTGEWGKEGRMAMLHEKELILNAKDTSNFLDALNISKEIINSMIEMNARASSLGFGELSPSNIPEWNQTLEQTVTITAEFPDAVDHNEIEEAFNNLLNTASQYANRNRD